MVLGKFPRGMRVLQRNGDGSRFQKTIQQMEASLLWFLLEQILPELRSSPLLLYLKGDKMKSLIYVCPSCRRLRICGLWQVLTDEIARILNFNYDKWEVEFKTCEDCQDTS